MLKNEIFCEESYSHISMSDEEHDHVHSETETETHITDKNINIKRKTFLRDLTNVKERNNSRINSYKRKQDQLITDDEWMHKNIPKHNDDIQKLPELYVVVRKIDETLKEGTNKKDESSKKRYNRI
ncbi:PREDICTED: uncharacterized protein LOC105448767 [Wasmannia auropunctata]|uniref:uncharacterized protein LOC105448767 n=1 Tax=Wasmannia auropunctata TaxID=64793 RepID=UPI0005EF24CC|nr:PREDICTED: uncharacterized protein LOC105448767 [Wasmannia auropunctata]